MWSKNILICVTGSVAAIKLPNLVELLLRDARFNFTIKIIVTEKSKHFFNRNDIPGSIAIVDDSVEWSSWQGRGDPVLHIDLVKWADLLIVAPLDANSLAKIACGICDNLLLCTIRAWDLTKPLLFCPAMNTKMWKHPITHEQIEKLTSWGYIEVPCISKTLMCGDTGIGAMATVETIVESVCNKCL